MQARTHHSHYSRREILLKSPVEVIHSRDQYRVARPMARVLTGELQPLPTGGVIGVSHKGRLVLVGVPWQVYATLSDWVQCGGGQCVPVGVCIAVTVA